MWKKIFKLIHFLPVHKVVSVDKYLVQWELELLILEQQVKMSIPTISKGNILTSVFCIINKVHSKCMLIASLRYTVYCELLKKEELSLFFCSFWPNKKLVCWWSRPRAISHLKCLLLRWAQTSHCSS